VQYRVYVKTLKGQSAHLCSCILVLNLPISCVATHRALDAIGVSPGYVGSTNGLLVSEYIDGSVLTEQDVQQRRIHGTLAELYVVLQKIYF
jgi:hypothetical protein